jgi:hypothetical protein
MVVYGARQDPQDRQHVDVPFFQNPVVQYVRRPFGDGRELILERFHEELNSAWFDAERADLD